MSTSMVETGRFYLKLLMSICTRASQGFLAENSLSLLLDTIDTSGSSFFISLYSTSKKKLKKKQINEFHKIQKRNFCTAHIVTQMSEVI